MKRLFLVMASGALLASPSTAQSGPVAQQSSDELVCKLTGDCAGAGATEATQDKGKSRGFSIAKPASPNASKPAVATPAPSTAKRYGSATTTRAAQPAGRRPVAAAPTSRADLMITFVSGSATLTEQAKANAQAFVGALGSSSMNGLPGDGRTTSGVIGSGTGPGCGPLACGGIGLATGRSFTQI